MAITSGTHGATIGIALGCLLLSLAASSSFEATHPETTCEDTATQGSNEATDDDYYDRPAAAFVANPFCKACHQDFDEDKLVMSTKSPVSAVSGVMANR